MNDDENNELNYEF